ncbi:MAG: hypothetical protein JW841_13750 [Deltaproteobacteria bacterium]|nr:hypothetical protein [Deltaproteobacteria bacterium]
MGEDIRELKEQAQKYISKRQQNKALSIFEKIISLDNQDTFSIKKIAELSESLGEKEKAANWYVQLAVQLNKEGRRLQAIASCKLAINAISPHAAAQALLVSLYQPESNVTPANFTLNPQALSHKPVAPPHRQNPIAQQEILPDATEEVALVAEENKTFTGSIFSNAITEHIEIFVSVLIELYATFSGTTLKAEKQSLANSIAGNTDFLWLIQFSDDAEHSVIVSAQRRFIREVTMRALDIDENMITDVMATKVSNKLISIYADDVKRAFANKGQTVNSGPPLPVTGENATYQLQGTRALHVPLSSEIGWTQITIAGGI